MPALQLKQIEEQLFLPSFEMHSAVWNLLCNYFFRTAYKNIL